MFILDLSTCERWIVVDLPLSHGNLPINVPFSPTEFGIVGGTGSKGPLNMITILNTETGNSSKCAAQVDDRLGLNCDSQ